ncbi:MAG: hypothetical protein QOD30_936 [Actinomycetota bacterium]|jgi:hypothetical protein|nr:hypothetical protein [Actinomycetota bacterium]
MSARRARGALLVALLLAIGVALVPNYARALDGTAFTIKANTTTEVDEPPIPGNDPASSQGSAVVGSPTPDQCALSPSCMTVPVKIEVPPRNAGDDFVVYLAFTWEQPSGLEDIDFWIYDDGQTAKNKGTTGYTEIASSASGDMPEKVKLYEPLFGTYNIVANNFSGANTGWHIKAESTVGKFEKPFESLAPAPGGQGTNNPNNKPVTRTTPTTVAAATTTTVTVPEGAIIPDDDFEGGKFDPNSYVDNAIAAGQDAQTASASRKPPSAASPSPISVIAWMILLPVAIIAGGFAFVRARRRARYAPASTSST